MHTSKRMTIAYLAMAAALLALFALNLFWGSIALSPADIAAALLGRALDALGGLGSPAGAALAPDPFGGFSFFAPTAGTYTFTYAATDGALTSAPATSGDVNE